MSLSAYRTFYDQDQATALVDLLKENNIGYSVTEDRESLDALYGDKQFRRQYFVKISQDDFAAVDTLLLNRSQAQLGNISADHYLFTFSNEELKDIISKPDEWNEFDYLLAQKILSERGHALAHGEIEKLKDERIRELAKPDKSNREWIYLGYLFAFFGGLLGIFIGWYLSTFRKTLPNGASVYAYDVNDRTHGNRILIIGIIMFFFWVVLGVLRSV